MICNEYIETSQQKQALSTTLTYQHAENVVVYIAGRHAAYLHIEQTHRDVCIHLESCLLECFFLKVIEILLHLEPDRF